MDSAGSQIAESQKHFQPCNPSKNLLQRGGQPRRRGTVVLCRRKANDLENSYADVRSQGDTVSHQTGRVVLSGTTFPILGSAAQSLWVTGSSDSQHSQNDTYAQGHWQAVLDGHLGSKTADSGQVATGGTTHDAVLSNQNGRGASYTCTCYFTKRI